MSIEAMSCAWHHSKHVGGELMVLLALADNANDEAICWPSQKYIARKCRISLRHVQRCIQSLTESGELVRLSTGTGRESSRYKINIEQMRALVNEGRHNVTPDTHVDPGTTPMSTKPSGNHKTSSIPVVPRPQETLTWSQEKSWKGVTEELKAELAAAYPACDIDRQLLAMEQWLKANPERAHKTNWRRFVTNWLAKEQDRGGDKRGTTRYETKNNERAGRDRRRPQANHGSDGGEGEGSGIPEFGQL